MAPRAPPLVQATSNREPNQTSSPSRKLKRRLKNVTAPSPKRPSTAGRKFADNFCLSQMWDEPLHTPSAREDDLLAGIERHQSELTSPTAMDEWCDIGLLSDAHPIQLPEDGWTPISAWFAHNDMYARLWEPANGGSDVVVDFDEIIGVADSGKEKEKKDDDNNDESLIDLVTERLNRSVTGQWPASSMEDSIDSLKSAMRKIKSIASPEESLKSREGRKWTSLLRL